MLLLVFPFVKSAGITMAKGELDHNPIGEQMNVKCEQKMNF